ncbi:MAG TPA: serine hydrolase domain-containing protein [Gemmataceae bacterium]|nr:serine hydrolase domain-containing protein [Gemmataceae bacterium]
MRFPFRPWCVLALVAASVARADTGPEPPKSFDQAAIDEYLAKKVAADGYVGLSVALVRDGKVVLAKGYGKTAVKDGAPVETSTPFAAGSITKQFTCACILMLQEEGKLSVKDKVSKYYPGLTRADEITLYDLMTHASGYADYYPLDFVDRRMEKPIPPDDLIKEYAGGKLDFAPGTRWSYSNTGFILLGRVVEKLSGKPFPEFLAERIFKPVGMADTLFEPKPGQKAVALGHTSFALGDAEPAPREADGWIHAAGALYTTPSDLAKWDLALIGGNVLKPESYKLMTTPRELADGRTRDYGCGLGVTRREGETILQHSGAVSGFLAYNAMVPRTKSAVILMTNCEHLDAGAIPREIMGLLLKAQDEGSVPKVSGPAPKEAALDLLHQFQAGEVKRAALGEEFSHYLNADRLRAAKERLGPLGEPVSVEVDDVTERGGMEVAVIRFTFKTVKAKASLYRTPDGKVQQFLLYKS